MLTAESLEQELTDPAAYRSASLDCDVVMKGGITSGVTYPWAVCEIARTYRLRSVGGSSAGAIAAAAAAASEVGRSSETGGFTRLAELPRLLGETAEETEPRARLLSLFQPSDATQPYFDLLIASLEAEELAATASAPCSAAFGGGRSWVPSRGGDRRSGDRRDHRGGRRGRVLGRPHPGRDHRHRIGPGRPGDRGGRRRGVRSPPGHPEEPVRRVHRLLGPGRRRPTAPHHLARRRVRPHGRSPGFAHPFDRGPGHTRARRPPVRDPPRDGGGRRAHPGRPRGPGPHVLCDGLDRGPVRPAAGRPGGGAPSSAPTGRW